jgi:hypothetical protein
MAVREGHGFLIRTAQDSPWAGWFSGPELGWGEQIKASPSLFLRRVGDLAALFPGGARVLWDATEASPSCGPALAAVLDGALLHLPGLSLHFKEGPLSDPVEAPLSAWMHSPTAPDGDVGARWRRGHVGWVPQAGGGWSLPGIGHVPEGADGCACGALWGVATVPAPAVGHLDDHALALALEDEQARIERAMSHRVGAGAWPGAVLFQRRRAAWRLELTGGREYALSGRPWEALASDVSRLREGLEGRLRCAVAVGVSTDPRAAAALGEQAFALGLPWRGALPLPPAPPCFTPGLAADPRRACPLDSRAAFPRAIAPLLSDPPVAHLRVPAAPSREGALAFLQRLDVVPAIRWIPPDMPPPGPFTADAPWDPAASFPGADAKASQPRLFDWGE